MTKKTAFILITLISLMSYGQDTLTNFLSVAPTTLFNNTTEGISSQEINNLVNKGESINWKISFKNNEKLIITCKHPFSQVTLFLLCKTNNASILVSFTENEEITTIETWTKNNSNTLEKVNMLPAIIAADFFLKQNQFKNIQQYNNRVYYTLDIETLTIKANFNTWMIAHEYFTEDKSADYNIELKWNGIAFKISKTRA